MMKLNFLVGALALTALASISATPARADGFDLSKLEAATTADLAAAKADADAHGDAVASQCYGGVADYIETHQGPNLTVGQVVGVASAFQAGRDAVKTVEGAAAQGAIPLALEIACGPLALDVQNDLGKAAGFSIFGLKF